LDLDPQLAPQRGSLILTLGIGSALLAPLGCACCVVFAIVGLGLGIVAWVMGRNDLAAMRAGAMDPSGAGTTNAGMICGIVGCALSALCLLLNLGMLALMVLPVSLDWFQHH
jgi:hypothetical protein